MFNSGIRTPHLGCSFQCAVLLAGFVLLSGCDSGADRTTATTIRTIPYVEAPFRTFELEEVGNDPALEVHVLDVWNGRAIIVDRGDSEVLIDAGDDSTLVRYLRASGLVDGPIELAIVSETDRGHFQGFQLAFTGSTAEEQPFVLRELWNPVFKRTGRLPGQARNARGARDRYGAFLSEIGRTPGIRIVHPSAYGVPATESGAIAPFTVPTLPGFRFTVFHADTTPEGSNEPNRVNNSSIVVMIEVDGARMLFPGDIEGTHISGDPRQSGLVEGELVALAQQFPGALRADVLVAPHSGSHSSSTLPFIAEVDPSVAIFVAQPSFGLPRDDVVRRYRRPERRLLSTGLHVEPDRDHVILRKDPLGWSSVYVAGSSRGVPAWRGALRDGTPIDSEELGRIVRRHSRTPSPRWPPPTTPEATPLAGSDLRGANLQRADLEGIDLSGADLSGANLSRARMRGARLAGAKLAYAYMPGVELCGADLSGASAPHIHLGFAMPGMLRQQCEIGPAATLPAFANLTGATLDSATLSWGFLGGAVLDGVSLRGADLTGADLRETSIVGGDLRARSFRGANLERAFLETDPDKLPPISALVTVDYLASLRYLHSPHALAAMRKQFQEGGNRRRERELTFAIEHEGRLQAGRVEGTVRYLLFEVTSAYGLSPWRPLLILLALIPVFAIPYTLSLFGNGRQGIWMMWPDGAVGRPADPRPVRLSARRGAGRGPAWWQRVRMASYSVRVGLYFSLISAFHVGFRELNVGTWIERMQAREYTLRATGWVRTVSGLQSLISLFLAALWLLTYFGNPFAQ